MAPGRAHRRYTTADVEVLARIGQLLHLGHWCDEVKHLLSPPPPGRSDEYAEPPARTEDAEREPRLCGLEEALARARRQIGSLEEQAVQYEHQLRAERAAHAETRRVLLEVQRRPLQPSPSPRKTTIVCGFTANGPKMQQSLPDPWDWEPEAPLYLLHHFILRQEGADWRTTHHQVRYRALRHAELSTMLGEAGFRDVRWRLPAESGYWQPVVTARKPNGAQR